MPMPAFRPRFTATHLPQVPYRDPQEACRIILEHFPEAPALPRLSQSLRMFLEGMPCVVADAERRRLWFDFSPQRQDELLAFYERIEAADVDYFAISPKLATGLYAMLERLQRDPPPGLKLVHIQPPGPVSWALAMADEAGNPAFHNETTRDVVVKTLAMKARWMERAVRQALPDVEVMVDLGEPSLVVHTSAVGSGARQDIIDAINGVLGGVQGITCVHCCANIDWSLLTDTVTQAINFDAYEYGDKLALYPEDMARFLERGGMLSWGIVPTSQDKLAGVEADMLVERLEAGIQSLVNKGIDRQRVADASWVTPCCTTATLSEESSDRVFALTADVARRMRARYFG